MTTIYIIRHGETEWNTQKRFQGQRNSALTPKGIKQAQCLAKYLENVNIDSVYSSSCERAVITAKIICGQRKINPHICGELMELDFGSWEGMLVDDIKIKYPEQYNNFFFEPEKYVPQGGGENLTDFKMRLTKKIDEIVKQHDNQTVVVVVHGIVLRVLLSYFKNCSLSEVWNFLAQPASLSKVFASNGKFSVEFWAQTSHYDCI